jgi:hypothetical protein
MQRISTYGIRIEGELDPVAFNAVSPYPVEVTRVGPTTTSFTVRVDQSGLVGMIRFLHNRSYVLLWLHRARSL